MWVVSYSLCGRVGDRRYIFNGPWRRASCMFLARAVRDCLHSTLLKLVVSGGRVHSAFYWCFFKG